MIEIHYTPAGKRVFVCYPVTELEIIVCPLGDDCLGDAQSCLAVAEALSRSDESTTAARTRAFIGYTAQRCFAACEDSRAARPCACNPPIDYTTEAQAALLMKLLKADCVLGMKARAFLDADEQRLLQALHAAATIAS